MAESSVFAPAAALDLRQAYPMHKRASSFTVTSSFHRREETKLEIHVEPDESLEVEMLPSTMLGAKGKHISQKSTSSLSPPVVDPTTTTKSSEKKQITSPFVGFGVAMRRSRSLPVQKSSYKAAVAMEAMRHVKDVQTSKDDMSTTSTQDSSAASTAEHAPPSPTASVKKDAVVPSPASTSKRRGLGRILGRKPRPYQMYMQSVTEKAPDDASTVNTSKTSEPSRKPYQTYKQSLSNNSEDESEALASALEVQRKKKAFLQSPLPKVVRVSPPRPEVRAPRKSRKIYDIYQQSISHSEDESDVIAHALEVRRQKEEFLSSVALNSAVNPPSTPTRKTKTNYSLYQHSLSLSNPTDEMAVVSAVMDAERRKKEFLMRPVVARSPPTPPMVPKESKSTMLSLASSMTEDRYTTKPNMLSPASSVGDDHTPTKANTMSPTTSMNDDHNSIKSESRLSPSDEPLPVLPVLATGNKSPVMSSQPLDEPLCETGGVEAVVETSSSNRNSILLQLTSSFVEAASMFFPSDDAPAQRCTQESKRVSPPPPTMRPTSPPPPTRRPASQMFTRRPSSPPPVTTISSRLSLLVAVDSMELEKRERSQQRDQARDATNAAGRGNRYQMPLHVLSDDVEEEYSGSDTSESCSTSRHDLSFNSSQSYSTMEEGSNYCSYDEDSARRGEYTDGEDPSYGEDSECTFDRVASPAKYFTRSFDNSTLESGSCFLDADNTYKMIDFYRLKNRRQRSGGYRSRNPGASWDNSEISDLFSHASHLYESSGVFLGRSASAVSEALWETQDEDDDESRASSAFAPIGTAAIQRNDSQSTAGGSAFMSFDRDKAGKAGKARVSDLPNNMSMLSSGSQLESINEHGADTDIDLDVDVEREALVRSSGWMCWGS